jgi:hypothetical protein
MFGKQICPLFLLSSSRKPNRICVCCFQIKLHLIHLVQTGNSLCIGWQIRLILIWNINFRIFVALLNSFQLRRRIPFIRIWLFELQSFSDFFFRNQPLNLKLFYIWIWIFFFTNRRIDRPLVKEYILIGSHTCSNCIYSRLKAIVDQWTKLKKLYLFNSFILSVNLDISLEIVQIFLSLFGKVSWENCIRVIPSLSCSFSHSFLSSFVIYWVDVFSWFKFANLSEISV